MISNPAMDSYAGPNMNVQTDDNNLWNDFQPRPDLRDYNLKKPIEKMKSIFRVLTPDLNIFFDEENLKLPDNKGESRESLNILKNFGYNEGLL